MSKQSNFLCLSHNTFRRIVWLTSDRSVIGRNVQSSWWPTILRADSAATHHVSRRVTSLTWFGTLTLILLGIAGVVTPLGLSESISLGRTVHPSFQYLEDGSSFGYGTAPRYSKFARVCGGVLEVNCPGRNDGYADPKNWGNGK